jgi:predicted transcriptional regulator
MGTNRTEKAARMVQRRPMGSLEARALVSLWAHPDGITPAGVRSELGDELAYTTVTTILTRLVKKGMAARERRGKVYLYSPAVSEADFAATRMRAALDQTRNHGAALARFVDELSAKDERLLRKVLEGGA